MKSLRAAIVFGCLGLSSVLFAQAGLSPEAQLKAAMNRETVDRDVAGAMELYKQIAEKFRGNHPVASKALLQMAGIYERMGKPEARSTYQRIVTEYADTGATAAVARARLTAIQDAAAGPFKWKSLDLWVKDAASVTTSPNGKYLVYAKAKAPSATGPQMNALYVREVSSGHERMLVDAKPDQVPFTRIVSPDNQRLAVSLRIADTMELRIISMAGGESRTVWKGPFVVPPPTFRWSPDSRSLACLVKTSKDQDIFEHRVVPAVAGDSVLIDTVKAAGSAALWSPDSRRVAYVLSATEADTIRIKTLGTDGTQSIVVPKVGPTSRVNLGMWLPGGEIQFVQTVSGGNDYYLVSSSGGTPHKICEGRGSSGGDGCQDLSPDGTLQITRKNVSGGGHIVLRSVKDGSERSLTPEAVTEQTALGFSPDGRLFGFRSNRDGSFGFYVVPTDSIPVATPIKIASLESDASGVSGTWTPGGMVVRITNNQTNQYRVDLDTGTGKPTGAPIRLTEDSAVNVSAHVSPDGRRIAYLSRSRPIGIALMDANGAHERVIKEVPPDMLSRMTLLGWMSDSELLLSDAKLGTGAVRDAPKHLMRMNVATGEMREAGPVVDGWAPYLAGEGNVFYVVKDDFLIRPIAGGPARPIKVDWWDFSVSTQWLAYSTADESGGQDKPMPGDIRVRSLETGAERIAVKFVDTDGGSQSPLDISRDGRFLLFQEPFGKVMMANIDTGESWPVLRNPPAGIDFEWTNARLSPDGTYLVLDGYISKTTWRAYEGVTYDAVTKLIGGKK